MISDRNTRNRETPPEHGDRSVLSRYRRRFANPRSAGAYDERFQTRKAATHRLEKRALRRVLSRLEDLDRTLDVPTGTGRLLGVASEHTREAVVASDVSVAMLHVARCRSDAAGDGSLFVQSDLLTLPFADGTFDAVVCIRFIHHLTSGRTRVEALRELARVSRRYVVVTFFDYLGAWGMRQGWKRLRGKTPNPSAVPLARFQAEAARAGLRFVRTVNVLPGLSEERMLLLEKDPEASALVDEAPERVSSRLRVGRSLSSLACLWMGLLAVAMLACPWWELEDVEALIWQPGILLMVLGAVLLAWSLQSCRARSERLDAGPYVLMRHPTFVGGALWLCGFALACELWWMSVLAWPAVLCGLWPAVEYAETLAWLRHGHAYDLYLQKTPMFVPRAETVWSLWVDVVRSPKLGRSRVKDLSASMYWTVWRWAALATSAGVALAVFKDISYT